MTLLSGCGVMADNWTVTEMKIDTEWQMIEPEGTEVPVAREAFPVYYVTQDHRILRKSDDDEIMLNANYYTIRLNKSTIENYPMLAKKIDAYNIYIANDIKKQADSVLKSVDEEYPVWKVTPLEVHRDYQVTRSDHMTFSFVIMNYEFLGGIHGNVTWFSHNINPKTGEEIEFSDVVTDTVELPEIIINELKLQHEDIMGYYNRMSYVEAMVRQYLIDYKLSNDAANLTWTIGDEGVWLYFDDYDLGCYSAGAKRVVIPYEKYPEIFTGVYSSASR